LGTRKNEIKGRERMTQGVNKMDTCLSTVRKGRETQYAEKEGVSLNLRSGLGPFHSNFHLLL